MNVHVTGGSGFLGGHVISSLRRRGHTVSALARNERAAQRVAELGATPVPGDLDDPSSVDAAFAASGADALVNVASLGFGHAPAIVSAAREAGFTRAIFVSSTSIFTTLDTTSKAVRVAAEDEVRASGLAWTIVRPTMIYGTPGDRNIARLLRALRRSPLVVVPGGGHRLQQPVHVADVAEALASCLEKPVSVERTYDVAGPGALSLRELIEQAAAAVGRRPRLVTFPLAPTVAAVRLYERTAPRPRLRAEQIERLAEDKAFDIEPARRELCFDPRPFSVGVREEAEMLT